ncbi:DUF5060 domain-containing protein [Candidatus Poribacteria bacterium]
MTIGMRAKSATILMAAVFLATACLGQSSTLERRGMGDLGGFDKWREIEITLAGPASQGRSDLNPFAIYVDVTFTSPTGRKYQVPGFYNGDGQGGLDGNIWMVRFSADETGTWTFASESENSNLDGYTGSFSVGEPASDAPDFYRWGRLEAVGTASNKIRYLKFRDGSYWLKAGCDSPENFLGDYENYNTSAKRRSAVKYLADRGINSMYIMTHNLSGDDKDVWSWLGESAGEARTNSSGSVRFDIARLEEWHQLFGYMQSEGVIPYIVLEDDSAWEGYDHARYYREIIARFGAFPALIFNFNEEHNENYSLSEALDYMQTLKDLDPYDHPRGIHNVNSPDEQYVDASQVDFTSIQTGDDRKATGGDPLKHNQLVVDWIRLCESRERRVLMVGVDEGRPAGDRTAWWSTYMGGGVWEAYVEKPYDQPMPAWEPVWTELGGTRTFMESLPFWQMQSHNELVISGEAFCLATPGEVYALYLPSGGDVTVDLAPGNYESAWWRPTNGKDGQFESAQRIVGGQQILKAPGQGDWALRIVKR